MEALYQMKTERSEKKNHHDFSWQFFFSSLSPELLIELLFVELD